VGLTQIANPANVTIGLDQNGGDFANLNQVSHATIPHTSARDLITTAEVHRTNGDG